MAAFQVFAQNRPLQQRPSGILPERKASFRAIPTLLTVREVAKRLRLSTATVYRLIHEKKIPAQRFGTSFRVRPEDLEKGRESGE